MVSDRGHHRLERQLNTSFLVIHQHRNSLTDVDRASLANIDELIISSEGLFATERQAWLSTSMVTKQIKAAADKEGGRDEAGDDGKV